MCIRPLRAHQTSPGLRPVLNSTGELRIPCQTCHECLKKRSIDFALRCQHELSYHQDSCFLNLTYDNEHVPTIQQFYKERLLFGNFLKRLRDSIYPKKIKYLASHEYGSQTQRPHHHAIIFGYSFSNWEPYEKTKKGHILYTSKELQKLWTYGSSKIGTATGASAYYIASYSLKSLKHDYTDPQTGETYLIKDKMTNSRGLGFQFLLDNQQSLVEYTNLPRYYRKLLQESHELHTMESQGKPMNTRLKNRLEKLRTLNPILHEHYDQKMTEYSLDAVEKNNHQQLASLEINNAQNQHQSTFRNSKSSYDKKLLQSERTRLEKLITEE